MSQTGEMTNRTRQIAIEMDKPPLGAINIFYNDYGEDPYIYLEVYPGMSKDLFEWP